MFIFRHTLALNPLRLTPKQSQILGHLSPITKSTQWSKGGRKRDTLPKHAAKSGHYTECLQTTHEEKIKNVSAVWWKKPKVQWEPRDNLVFKGGAAWAMWCCCTWSTHDLAKDSAGQHCSIDIILWCIGDNVFNKFFMTDFYLGQSVPISYYRALQEVYLLDFLV